MSDPTPTPPLTPDAASRLAEFSRVCKAAARAVSLYPGGHPAIGVSLSRLEQATNEADRRGPVQGPGAVRRPPHRRRADGQARPGRGGARGPPPPPPDRPADASTPAPTPNPGARFCSCSRAARRKCAPTVASARLWATAGGPSLEISEIDYAEVLREKQGLAATIDSIIEAAMSGPTLTVDDAAMRAVVDIIKDPGKLEQLMQTLETTASRSPQGVELQTAALLNIVRGLVDYVGRTDPQQLNTVFEQFGRGARHLSVEAMIALLAERKRPEAMAGSVNVVSALIESMSDGSVAGFVADSVVAERGASERLAHAFRSLVPEFDRQRQLLALAREEVASSEMAREQDPGGVQGTVERRRADADVVHRRALRLGGLRARAVARPHAAGRRRAGQRRPARANRRLAVDGQRRRAAQPRPGSADRPAAHRDRSVALARRRRHGRHARGRPRARGPLRSGVAAHRDA